MDTDQSDVVDSLRRPAYLPHRRHPMQDSVLLVTALVRLGGPALAPAGPQDEVAAVPQAWAEAVPSRDPAQVLARADLEAVCWGTVSPT